jgi:hypothetical protein
VLSWSRNPMNFVEYFVVIGEGFYFEMRVAKGNILSVTCWEEISVRMLFDISMCVHWLRINELRINGTIKIEIIPSAVCQTKEPLADRLANRPINVRFQDLTAASMKFRFYLLGCSILPCKIIVDRRFRCSDDGGSTYLWNIGRQLFSRQYIPADKSELQSD